MKLMRNNPPSRVHDMNSQIQWERLPAGALRIGDLGYYNLKEFKKMDSDGMYWLSRVKSNCVLVTIHLCWLSVSG